LALTAEMRFRFFTTDLTGRLVVEAAVDDLELTVSLGRIVGRVVDAVTGDPLEASIDFHVRERTTTLTSDDTGRFTFVSAGDSVEVVARAPGYRESRAVVELESFQTIHLTLEMLELPTLSVSGVVVSHGSGVAAAMVRLLDTEFETSTDASGRFTLSGVPAGVYRIAAEKPNYVGEPIEVEVSEENAEELTLELEPMFSTEQDAAFPNPFRDGTSLSFRLARTAHVRLSIFDPSGREVRRLLDAEQNVGAHTIPWDGRDEEGRRL